MESQSQKTQPSMIVRFFDAFLNENNIKWILGAGVLILLGSSAMLVANHFDDLNTPLWKYTIMFAYTAAIYGAGNWCYHYMSLRKTGTVLMVLCVLLFPVLFLALHWVQDERWWLNLENALLLAGTLVFTYWSAGRIFRHLLLKPQPTFLVSYVFLCLGNSLASLVSPAAAPFFAAFMWGMFLIGSIKVNRHVFWLTEEYRAPRIFGFFPIALLGVQFLVVFTIYLAPFINIAWMGFGCALMALPVLMTADTVWKVHKQRTGGLGEPKAAIMAPVITGLILCAAALCTAASGLLDYGSPYALVPTAVAVAIMTGMVAHRTNSTPLVWSMLACVLVAYNFSPVFFLDLARAVAQTGADALGEEKLPYAFYGLTYLPLISMLTALGRFYAKKENRLFGHPIRAFSIFLPCIWLFLSLTEIKAMLPVGLAMTAAFGAQAFLFRKPGLMIFAGIAWMSASFGIGPFLHGAFETMTSNISRPDEIFLATSLGAMLLFMSGYYLDRRLRNLTQGNESWLQMVSVVSTVLLSTAWLLSFGLFESLTALAVLSCLVLLGLLVLHCLKWNRLDLDIWCIVYSYTIGIVLWMPFDPAFSTITSVVSLALIGQWILSYALDGPHIPMEIRLLGHAFRKIAYVGLFSMLFQASIFPLLEMAAPFWTCRVMLVGWAFDAARRSRKPKLGYAASAALMCLVTADVMYLLGDDTGLRWLLFIWASLAMILLTIVIRLIPAQGSEDKGVRIALVPSVAIPLKNTLRLVLGFCTIWSLLSFDWPCRIAGGVSLAGLWIFIPHKKHRWSVLVLANFHLLNAAITVAAPQANKILALMYHAPATTLIAAITGLSLLAWQIALPVLRKHLPEPSNIIKLNRGILYSILAIMLLITFDMRLTPMCVVFCSMAFLGAICNELVSACIQQQQRRVWIAEMIAAAMVVHLVIHGVVHFGRGISMFAVLLAGAFLWLAARFSRGRQTLSIMNRPFYQTALVLPAVTAFLALFRPVLGLDTVWLGARSLALFLAAAAYFFHGMTRNVTRSVVGSAVIVNLALFLLWDELSWSDPQLFMIPVGITIILLTRFLGNTIPPNFHRPMHYLGALVILVSPTFNIVTGNWLHMFSLMVISVAVMLGAIGLRLKALLYTGTAFLAADVVAMVIRRSVDQPNILWVTGLVLGVAVVALGAFTERNRENLLQQIRMLNANLGTWK